MTPPFDPNVALPLEVGASRRSGVGLCLSGGGYRAALFHLGATRRLDELGLLTSLRTVSSVSGGSVLAGVLATGLPWPLSSNVGFARFEGAVAQPMRDLSARDIRTGPILARILPWRWRGPSAVYGLAEHLEDLYGRARLHDLPDAPKFVLCATDLTFGVNWEFGGTASGSYRAGYVRSEDLNWSLALAVATSACFPPVFAPVTLPLDPRRVRRSEARRQLPGEAYARLLANVRLNDGGNYDNLGLEPVWKSHALVLVSDGGARLPFGVGDGPWANFTRFIAVTDAQARSLRRRWLIAGTRGQGGAYHAVYWAVGGHVGLYAKRLPANAACLRLGYGREIGERIGRIRTDFNVFREGERCVLENHGYLMADAALRAHLPPAFEPRVWPSVHVPHPAWQGDVAARRALRV